MKKVILITAMLLMSTPAMAATIDEMCTGYSNLAAQVMGYRQSGIPFTTVYNNISDKFKPIVVMAYEEPAYFSPEMKQRAKVDFSNEFMRGCLKSNQE